jgi:hypothetical protein
MWDITMSSETNIKENALAVMYSRDHQVARSIVRLYHNGVSVPEICSQLGISHQKANEVLL